MISAASSTLQYVSFTYLKGYGCRLDLLHFDFIHQYYLFDSFDHLKDI